MPDELNYPLDVSQAPATLPESGYAQEFLPGGNSYNGFGILPYGETNFDKATQAYGFIRVVRQMLADPKVSSTLDSLKMGILSDGIQVTPAIIPQFDSEDETEFDSIGRDDAENAFEAAEFVCRCIDRITNSFPMETFCWQLLDAIIYGVKLGEKVCEIAESGDDAGKLVISKIKIKSQLSWSFIRDGFGNLLGISGGISTQVGKFSAIPRDKFIVLTCDPEQDDPRGRTVLVRIYDSFYAKYQTLIRYATYLKKFAAPFIVGSVGENEQVQPVRDSVSGKTTTSSTTPVKAMSTALAGVESCSFIAIAYGAKVDLKFPTGNGEAFLAALGYHDKQIVSGMLHTARATEESQFGSRADSETAQDDKGVLIRYYKNLLARCVREDIARFLLEKNKGKDYADKYTPIISFGLTEHQDFSRNAGAVAKLWMSNFLDESQRPKLCTFLGLPLPKPRKVDPNADPATQNGAAPIVDKAPAEKGKKASPKDLAKPSR